MTGTGGGETLDGLVAECLERLEGEGPEGIEAVCREHPREADALRERLRRLADVGLLDTGAMGEREEFPETLGDFRLLGRLGRGGMGVVYLAEQRPLGRRVALKLISPDQLYFSHTRERFRREVETVARLQHPGIVPVYTLGEERGIPYFAMEYVEGCTMAQALALLAGADPRQLTGRDLWRAIRSSRSGSADGLADTEDPEDSAEPGYVFAGTWEQVCLRLVRQVAEAVDHAHQRGVLHRDIKPSNVMLTPGGRAMLLDFGLASSPGSRSLTRSGTLVGSLVYMSPEQTRGAQREGLTAATDVYSLGATLYELLTLRPAFGGTTVAEVVLAIERGAKPAPRALNPDLSWEAETVCLTAMEIEAGRRYASAGELARDLENVLDRRPIEARRASAWLRARRWAQRHPAASVAVALGSLLLVGAPTAYAVQQRQANLRVAQERDAADEQRVLAEENLDQALNAIERMLGRLGEKDLLDVPRMDDVRRALLADAVELLDGLLAKGNSSRRVRHEAGKALLRLAVLQTNLGDAEEARAARERIEPLLAEMLAEDPDDPETLYLMAEARDHDGLVAVSESRLEEGLGLLQQALEIATELVEREPENLRYLRILGRAQRDLATVAAVEGRYDEAEAGLRAGLASLELALERGPGDLDTRFEIERAHHELGSMFFGAGDYVRAEEALREAIRLEEAILEETPQSLYLRNDLALELGNLATVLGRLGRGEEAEELTERSIAMRRELVREFPLHVGIQRGLATNCIGRGHQLMRRAEPQRALPYYVEAEALLRPIVASGAEGPGAVSDLARALHGVGQAQHELGEPDRALPHLREAVRLQRGVLAGAPTNVTVARHLNFHYHVLAFALLELDLAELHEELAQAARGILQTGPGGWQEFRYAASWLVSSGLAAERDPRAGEDARFLATEAYLTEAADVLRRAVTAGHRAEVGAALGAPEFEAALVSAPFEALAAELGSSPGDAGAGR